ncbi:MAG: hypothetical protein ACR2QU_10375 [Gammaproteobacteria bacterium]
MASSPLRIEPSIGTGAVGTGWVDGRPAVAAAAPRPLLLTLVAGLLLAHGLGEILLFFGAWPSNLELTRLNSLLPDQWPMASLIVGLTSAFTGALLIAGRPVGWYLGILICIGGLGAAAYGLATAMHGSSPSFSWFGLALSLRSSLALGAVLILTLLAYLLSRPVRAHCRIRS